MNHTSASRPLTSSIATLCGATRSSKATALAAALTLGLGFASAQAANVQWDLAGSGSYLVPTNWLGGSVPLASDTAILNKNGAEILVDLGDDITVNSFFAEDGEFTMSGGTLNATTLFQGRAPGAGATLSDALVTISGGTLTTPSFQMLNGAAANVSGDAQITARLDVRVRNGSEMNFSGSSILNAGKLVLEVNNASLPQYSTITVSEFATVIQNAPNNGSARNELWLGSGGEGRLTVKDNAQWVQYATSTSSDVVIGRDGTGILTIEDNALFSVRAGDNNGFEEGGTAVAVRPIRVGEDPNTGNATTSHGIVNLNGGTLETVGFVRSNNGLGTINANGGTIRALGSSTNFFNNFTGTGLGDPNSVNLLAGGLTFDTGAFAVTITNNLSGEGGLTKFGNGTLTLNNINSYEGVTRVEQGTLFLTTPDSLPGYANPGRLEVQMGAVLGLNVGGAGEFTLADIETMRSNGAFMGTVALALNTNNALSDLVYTAGEAELASFQKLGQMKLTLANISSIDGSLDVGVNNDGGTLAFGAVDLSVGELLGGDIRIGVTNTATAAIGTLDLSGAKSFSTMVNNIIIGSAGNNNATAQGTLILPVNSDIMAMTSFVIGSSAGVRNTPVSSVTTGNGGVTRIATPSLQIGSAKSNAEFTLGEGATLELRGIFDGERAALGVGRGGDLFGGGGNYAGTADFSKGIFKGELSSLTVGRTQAGNGGYTQAGTLLISDNAANHLDIRGFENPVQIGQWINGGSPTEGDVVAASGLVTIGNLDATSSIFVEDNSTAISIATGGEDGVKRAEGTLNLNGGTLTITTEGAAISGDAVNKSNVSTVNFNGTTLVAGSASANWITAITAANVGDGGAKFDTNGFDVAFDQQLLHSSAAAVVDGGLTKSGDGALSILGESSYTGATTVNGGALDVNAALTATTGLVLNGAGSQLRIGADNLLNDAAGVTLNGGTLATLGFSDTVGELKLETASLIDLGDGTSTLRFADSSALTWTGTLGILNWSGLTLGGGDDQIYFGNNFTGLTVDQLALIAFINPTGFEPGTYNAAILPTGEIIAVPEPGSLALLVGAASLLGFRRRRRS